MDEEKKEEFECPRMEGNTNFGKAKWERRGVYRACSHCGSMHPDDVIEAVGALGKNIVEQSTKGYKYYIDLPNVKNAQDGPIKFYLQHFTDNQIKKYNNIGNSGKNGS